MGTALVGALASVLTAIIVSVIGPLVARARNNTDAIEIGPDDELDVLRAMSALVAQQEHEIGDLKTQLTAAQIRLAECMAREDVRREAT